LIFIANACISVVLTVQFPAIMRYVVLTILLTLPLWLLNYFVMPELTSLGNTYAHADTYATKAVGVSEPLYNQ
jgi:hypothetical protein